MAERSEDRELLDAAVKSSDGFFTTFFVSPYSKFLARWFARRGWTPNAVTLLSMLLGLGTAALFATGQRWGLISGAVALQLAFTFDCVDGQLARYTRQFSPFGAWLDAVFDRGKEYLAYAALAVGAAVGFDMNVWALALAALSLQTVRHTVDFSFPHSRRHSSTVRSESAVGSPVRAPAVGATGVSEPTAGSERSGCGGEPPTGSGSVRDVPRTARGRLARLARRARGWVYWVKRIVVLPIGERFALISLTTAVSTPRITFLALLCWGGLALLYQLSGRIMRSLT